MCGFLFKILSPVGIMVEQLDSAGLAFTIAPLLGGLFIGMRTKDAMSDGWYASLERPPWTPPKWAFGPVWSILYLLMGYAAWRVWSSGGGAWPMALFGIQLVLNYAWSILFFEQRSLPWASFDVAALLIVLVMMTHAYARVDSLAANLTIPYVAWVSLATALTFDITSRNNKW